MIFFFYLPLGKAHCTTATSLGMGKGKKLYMLLQLQASPFFKPKKQVVQRQCSFVHRRRSPSRSEHSVSTRQGQKYVGSVQFTSSQVNRPDFLMFSCLFMWLYMVLSPLHKSQIFQMLVKYSSGPGVGNLMSHNMTGIKPNCTVLLFTVYCIHYFHQKGAIFIDFIH